MKNLEGARDRLLRYALDGLPGKIVRELEPHTEADPIALLVNSLVTFGAMVGPGPYYEVGGDRHQPRLFALLLGDTAASRKGTSWRMIKRLFCMADPLFENNIVNGLVSGEGLIHHVRNPVSAWSEERQESVITDPGVEDKRLLVIEEEFSRVLKGMNRSGSVLGDVIRCAWDGEPLSTMAKHHPERATSPYISIIGHCTPDETRTRLTSTDCSNGFANRFLFVSVRRSNRLPFGGKPEKVDFGSMAETISNRLSEARRKERINMDEGARKVWIKLYDNLSEVPPGLLGNLTARGPAQVLRIAMIYALMDGSASIGAKHLYAGKMLWAYCVESTKHVFGILTGNRDADRILDFIAERTDEGKPTTKTDISHGLFQRNKRKKDISDAVILLILMEKIVVRESESPKATVYESVPGTT